MGAGGTCHVSQAGLTSVQWSWGFALLLVFLVTGIWSFGLHRPTSHGSTAASAESLSCAHPLKAGQSSFEEDSCSLGVQHGAGTWRSVLRAALWLPPTSPCLWCKAAFGSRIMDLEVRQARGRLLAPAVLAGKLAQALAAPRGTPGGGDGDCMLLIDEGHIRGLSSEDTNRTVVACSCHCCH